MGPKKDVVKKENGAKTPSIDDPINSDSWKCVVVMAVERSSLDSFVLEEFKEEALQGRRQEVQLIHFNALVMKVLNDFANGELPFKYVFLLNFSSVFQEASDYAKSNTDIPVPLLVKVVKALLLLLREESLERIVKKALGPLDAIKTMADRPTNFGGPVEAKTKANAQKKEQGSAKGGVNVRPPSVTKQDTNLLKRGEGVKENQCIDDSPADGFFNLYVLLTGFYHPDFPLELIKAGIPLHGILCIDTSSSITKRVNTSTDNIFQTPHFEAKPEEIDNFWNSFLKILWDPEVSFYFKDTIFQVYTPRKLLCDDKKLKEFIYKEISYLMYDMSDFKRQHNNYLRHMKLWNVEEENKHVAFTESVLEFDDLPNECVTVPVVLQCIVDAICKDSETSFDSQKSITFGSIDSELTESTSHQSSVSQSILVKYGSSVFSPIWSQIVSEAADSNTYEVYSKVKELYNKYELDQISDLDTSSRSDDSARNALSKENNSQALCCLRKPKVVTENLEEALNSEGGLFRSCWRKFKRNSTAESNSFSIVMDYCLHLLLMTKVPCPYQLSTPSVTSPEKSFLSGDFSIKNSNYEIIGNLCEEMRKPHFTVTEGSRNLLKSIPFNVKEVNRNFFCPLHLKIVTPEKMKASSAPEFRRPPNLTTEVSFVSDCIISDDLLRGVTLRVYENVREFVGEYLFSNVNGFDFVEELSQKKLLSSEQEMCDNYNCVDCSYSVLIDSIFVALHNRKSDDDTHHETFNEMLKTGVGLRDFFDYVLEDESTWFKTQEELRQEEISTSAKKLSLPDTFRELTDSDFWMNNSIKYQEFLKLASSSRKLLKELKYKSIFENGTKEMKKGANNENKSLKNDLTKDSKEIITSKSESIFAQPGEPHDFEGYNVSDMAVQYSGLKTVYHVDDSAMEVELIERLYGNQDLGIHIRLGGHTLHLYSYVCPKPHFIDPYTCHLTCKSGIIVAFSRRFVEAFEEVEEIIEAKATVSKSKRTSSELPPFEKVKKIRRISKLVEDDRFFYDMKLSLPNGLTVAVIAKIANPCYVKQLYLVKCDSSSETVRDENCRLFMPNGNVVKMLNDGTVHILKVDSSVVIAYLEDLVSGTSENGAEQRQDNHDDRLLAFTKYEIVMPTGYVCKVDQNKLISSERLLIFQNTDTGTNTTYFRRDDGTNYMVQKDGTLCIQFKDGTKISSSVFMVEGVNGASLTEDECVSEEEEEEEEIPGETDVESEFIFIFMEVIVEHPDYATVVFNGQTQKWKILLPFHSAIEVEPRGNYSVKVDEQTELVINSELIQMSRFSDERELHCKATADLTVFENSKAEKIYCKMEDSTGKTFVVEANSKCYVLPNVQEDSSNDEEIIVENLTEAEEKSQDGSEEYQSQSQFLASQDLVGYPSTEKSYWQNKKGNKLSRDKRYFVVRKDGSGCEILHKDDVNKILTETKEGSMIFTQEIPGPEKLRCFVLICPAPKTKAKGRKWEVDSILPNPKYVPNGTKITTSSTYGEPPSWMHPFPKRKKKIEVPQQLTCRVFIETKSSEFSFPAGSLDCGFCEIDEVPQINHSKIEPGIENIQDYIKRLSHDDQDMLKEMYSLAAVEMLSRKKNLRSFDNEKLQHYLAMSQYYVEMQEYHKKSIRYHIVPNYFHHPAGMSWLLLNDLINVLKLSKGGSKEQRQRRVRAPPSVDSTSTLSYEEIEYNLEWSSEPSYSDLECRTDISMKTAPANLSRDPFCQCKIRETASAPIVKLTDQVSFEDESEALGFRPCYFEKEELFALRQTSLEQGEQKALVTLEDLMCLGLI